MTNQENTNTLKSNNIVKVVLFLLPLNKISSCIKRDNKEKQCTICNLIVYTFSNKHRSVFIKDKPVFDDMLKH